MNTDQAREKLLDLVYGELDDDARRAVMGQVRSSPELQSELAALRQARAALAKYRAGEPAAPPRVAEADRLRPIRRARPLFRWLSPLAAAAVVVAGLVIWHLLGPGTKTVTAQPGPVEIKRTDVSVTILSSPEDQPPAPMYQAQQAAVQ
ncbi:MAG TPA: hypothetical protein VM098_04760, partial [Phycisphaerae bacterium]|nr:hypothetical protein [Phycisphaerae bacterium]